MAVDDRILAQIARKGGARLLGRAVNTLVPAEKAAARTSLLGGIAGALAVRVALRSVPGAIVVGSGLLAKKLYDLRHGKAAGDASGLAPGEGKAKPKA